MKRLILLLSVVLLAVSASMLQVDVIHVPSQQPTIQAGIDAAVDGDTVLVADGTYTGDGNRDIDFLGKAIVVTSENGPESCIIDCEGSEVNVHRGFYFHTGEGSSSVVKGFTITNGYYANGGGIYCYASSPMIVGNTITGNTTGAGGGGIYCQENSSPTITGNMITGNTATTRGGGGIRCKSSSPTITGNMITGNDAGNNGGGIYCYASSPMIVGNMITGNTATNRGGGGIYCNSSSPTITSNTITGNIAGNEGGGGIYCWESSPIFTGNTITGNIADNEGGGAISFYFSSATITNCILWGDWPDEILNVYGGTHVVTYSDVQGGWEGEGNIDEDPMFVLADKDDYRLLWESPCIDTGDPALFDLDGTRSDMGAHYFNQNDYLTLYLTPDMTEVYPGNQFGVTYTAINRWELPEPFWLLSQVLLPGGDSLNVLGPDQYTLPANYTAQVHVNHPVPQVTPTGVYEYISQIGMPPGTLYDYDNFKFTVTE